MNNPTITLNTATGSDSAASGAGPATALSGTAASYSGSVFTLDGSPDLSGVATDGSHVIWVGTSTGRQFFTISAVDDGADTVTVDDAPAGTSSGLSWGIGGKRNDLDATSNRRLFNADSKTGWDIVLEDDQTISSAITVSDQGNKVRVKGSSEHVTITQTANASHFTGDPGDWVFEALKFENTNGSKTSANAVFFSSGFNVVILKNCIFGDATNTLESAVGRSSGQHKITFIDCEIAHCTGWGIQTYGGGASQLSVCHCWIHDNGSGGVFAQYSDQASLIFMGNLIVDNTGDGINFGGTSFDGYPVIVGNVIDDNTGDGVDLGSDTQANQVAITNNIITANGAYGINAGGSEYFPTLVSHNNFGAGASANTSGAHSWSSDPPFAYADNVTVDPQFTDAANDDYRVGANMQAAGMPDASRYLGANQSATRSYVDIGAAQRQEANATTIIQHKRKVI